MNRESILTKELKIHHSEIEWCFISNYYDAPIEGLVYFKNSIWRFCCFPEDVPEQSIYVIQKLTQNELRIELRGKEKFEKMVGTHWSYNIEGNPLPESDATEESSKQYYDEQVENISLNPVDREIVAWFDCAEANDEQA